MSNLSVWKQQLATAQVKMSNLLDTERVNSELGFAAQIFENSSALQGCDPKSIMNAVVNIARTNITLNPVMKLAYLIPRKRKCILEFSYMGLVKMLKDNNAIKHIEAHIVFDDEDFVYDTSMGTIKHTPKYAETEQEHNARKIKGVYSVATLPTNDKVYCFMAMWEVDKVKNMSDGASSKYSPWNNWRDEMIKKSVIKRHFKMLISENPNPNLQSVLEIEDENSKLTSMIKPKMSAAFDDIEVISEPPMDNPKSTIDELMQNTTPPQFSDEKQQKEMFAIKPKDSEPIKK